MGRPGSLGLEASTAPWTPRPAPWPAGISDVQPRPASPPDLAPPAHPSVVVATMAVGHHVEPKPAGASDIRPHLAPLLQRADQSWQANPDRRRPTTRRPLRSDRQNRRKT